DLENQHRFAHNMRRFQNVIDTDKCDVLSSSGASMNYYDNVLGLIGHTPLIKLSRLNKGLKPLILAKMENLNPGFSVKDRIGISMIEAAEREGKLKPGGTIV